MPAEGVLDREETILTAALADAGKSGTFNVTRWKRILELIGDSVKRGKQMTIDADLHKTYRDWFRHVKQNHNFFPLEEEWRSIVMDQLQTIDALKYCQKCHEPWNANGLARHETSCRMNIEIAQAHTSEAANQAAAAVQPGDIEDVGTKDVIVDWKTTTPELQG